LLPALLSEGLLQTTKHYKLETSHYYSVESIMLTLAFMFLARIKNPEQLKQCKPGELGKWIGLDRVPEMKCLREKIASFSSQSKTTELNDSLISHWYNDKEHKEDFYYIDGHQRIYYGSKANLPKKYISRMKLCLSATTEYWVNDAKSMPMLVTLGELSENLQHIIEKQIIPQLIQSKILVTQDFYDSTDQTPRLTLIFDREAYEPAFFIRLWNKYRIAIITYRKHVNDQWEISKFKEFKNSEDFTVSLCEQFFEVNNHHFREIRKLSDTGHQTSIITTHPSLEIGEIAQRMFYRWTQENYFKYMIADYNFDKMIAYGTEEIQETKTIVNPKYRKLTNELKKLRAKKSRIEAKFFPLVDKMIDENIEKVPSLTKKQHEYKTQIDIYQKEIQEVINERNITPNRITLKEMPNDKQINKLKTESKMLINIIKMICYRAETAICALIAPHLKKYNDEKRMFVKQIITNNADMIPDYKNKKLIIKLHALSTPRYNDALKNLCQILNETKTVFPSTQLTLFFQFSVN
jgi:hypothetical protein